MTQQRDGIRNAAYGLTDEQARRTEEAGPADIVRESIDGATMYELMAAAEGRPSTDWLKPWKPATA